ncbi:MAG: Nucleotidyltransferase domain protein [Candidatus Methanofastidiosum methylothiophilum]|uniref:protein adenylyltransferase n=1 Tax=Candidatus Methanofastidiosum methylothiophilum TaxID=1705564 RepID=A0A150ILS5_9EURY|nr:MAG: Nucleotidyltransferase domain protein [Candidatus Methanofastidiosum methylthiophilus]KYC48249.1 MAG: Nucleotidyltransferase domain protein [Candidatus Methanofastidiosum methylthiophilus]KYC50906.1 MAG: Nucleotidyltransferase domain protein [Candidatus Methanofastidiosum methylthiophilus]
MGQNTILKLIQSNETIIKKYGVSRVGLFGSYSTGLETPKSDIDILVEFESGKKNFDNYMGLKFYLEDLFQKKVDLVIKESIRPKLKEKILKDVIYA